MYQFHEAYALEGRLHYSGLSLVNAMLADWTGPVALKPLVDTIFVESVETWKRPLFVTFTEIRHRQPPLCSYAAAFRTSMQIVHALCSGGVSWTSSAETMCVGK